MAIEIGKRVSRELREYIETFTTPDERKQIMLQYPFGRSAATQALNGYDTLSKSTHPLILDYIKLAMQNRTLKMKTLSKVHNEVTQYAKHI